MKENISLFLLQTSNSLGRKNIPVATGASLSTITSAKQNIKFNLVFRKNRK